MSEKDKKELLLQQLKKHVRALLISAPNGLNIVEIQNDYLKMFGKPLPYRYLGFEQPLGLLKAMSDVVRPTWVKGELILRGIADETSERIAKLVARQRKSPKKRATHVIREKPLQSPTVPYYIRTKVQELLTYYPNGILGSRFLDAFQRHFEIDLDFKKLGFPMLKSLLTTMPDVVKIQSIALGGYRVYGKNNISEENTNKSPSSVGSKERQTLNSNRDNTLRSSVNKASNDEESLQKEVKKLLISHSGVSQNLKNEIRQILSKRPNGVWAVRLPKEYKQCFEKELRVQDHGFATVVELVDAMPDIVRIERPTKTGDWLLYGVKEVNDQNNQIEAKSDRPGPEEDMQSNRAKSKGNVLQVDDGVGQGIYFQNPQMPDTGYFTLYVSHCVDPQDFWVICRDEWPKVEALGQDISIFYNSSEGDKYVMPEWLVSVGQVCCAWSEDYEDWFRAVIIRAKSVRSIEVFYVDYGNISQVALSELRILRTSFLKIPGQACHSQLAYIKPEKGTEWSPGCCHRFYHITKNYKPLYGLLCGTKNGKLSLCLIDTSTDEDLHVNDLLVDEGFAVFCPDSPVSPKTQPTEPVFTQSPLEKVNEEMKPPGLPPAREGQQLFNQHVAASFPSTDSLEDMAFIEEICREIDQGTEEKYILKRLCLMDMCTIHVINYHRVPYVTSADVSVLLWDSDVLRAMLRQKKMVVPKLVLCNEEDSELIEQLVKNNVRGVMDGDTPRDFVTLYPLTSLPYILRKFNHPLEDLVSRVEVEVQQFVNEGDEYWLVKDDLQSDSTGTGSESRDEDISSDVEQLEIEELSLVIQALQFRRKRILQDLMTPNPSGTQHAVEELVEVENKIENLRREVLRKDAKNKL